MDIAGTFSGDGGNLSNVTATTLGPNTFSSVPVQTNSNSASGTYSFTVPPNAGQMVVKLWGAGGGFEGSYLGGGGAFAQVTLSVTPGDTYVIVAGQGGENGGGAGANDGSGGSGSPIFNAGGQASSLFKFTGSHYIMKAVAGGGGGASPVYSIGGGPGLNSGSGIGYSTNALIIGE